MQETENQEMHCEIVCLRNDEEDIPSFLDRTWVMITPIGMLKRKEGILSSPTQRQ